MTRRSAATPVRRIAWHARAAQQPAIGAEALLQLMRLASPSLPVGGFSYSEGLESAVDSGLVASEGDATRWLVDQLHLGLARCELAIVARALDAWRRDDTARVAELNAWFSATRETHEQRLQAEQTGRSLAVWMRHRGVGAEGEADGARLDTLDRLAPAPTWPIAFALAAAGVRAAPRDVLLAYAAGWAENMVQAAMKAVPLGQIAAQRILAGLAAETPGAVDAALAAPMAQWQAFTPMLAILSARHEEQYSRIFRS